MGRRPPAPPPTAAPRLPPGLPTIGTASGCTHTQTQGIEPNRLGERESYVYQGPDTESNASQARARYTSGGGTYNSCAPFKSVQNALCKRSARGSSAVRTTFPEGMVRDATANTDATGGIYLQSGSKTSSSCVEGRGVHYDRTRRTRSSATSAPRSVSPPIPYPISSRARTEMH